MTAAEKCARRVLVIGAIWPYHGGGARVPGLAKYLPEWGWEPVVLTQPLPPDVRLPYRVETVGGDVVGAQLARGLGLEGEGGPRRNLARKLGVSSENPVLRWGFRVVREVLQYPDGHRKWRSAALQRALELVGDEQFDAVISTSPPISTHLIAAEVKRKHGLTWLADFPHLWSQDHGVPYGGLRRWFDWRLEVRTLAGADVLTTTNTGHARILESMHGAKHVNAVSHGFDPGTVNDPPVPLAAKFTMTYTGGLSKGMREPRMLFQAVAGLVREGLLDRDRVEIRFYGAWQDWVQEQIEHYHVADVARQYGQVPQSMAFACQRESHLLLSFKCEPGIGEGILSSKIFEYLAARRPVLSVGPGFDMSDVIVRDTRAGGVVEDVKGLQDSVMAAYAEWNSTGTVAWTGSVTHVEPYNQRMMAREFGRLLEMPDS